MFQLLSASPLLRSRVDRLWRRLLLPGLGVVVWIAAALGAQAGTVSYNTTGSTLSANGVPGAVQNTSTSVTVGGLTFTYNAGSGSGVTTPGIISLGNIVTTGTSTGTNVTGLLLTINVNSTPPGASGSLPNGAISGNISTNNSGATILFSPNNTTTGFGTLPGVTISGGSGSYVYQVLNPSLGLQAPTVGNPVGQTSIQGTVTDTSSRVAPNSGTTPQSALVGTAFTNAPAVTVLNGSTPVSGVSVTFTAPASGASGTFANSTNTMTVVTNGSGVASAPFTANASTGSYTVTAAATGYITGSFSLTNTVEAPSLVVTTTNDVVSNADGVTSLREAIAYAATLTGGQTITFSNSTANGATNFSDGTTRTITLGGSELAINGSVTITGPGAGSLTISGNNASRVFNVGGTAAISGLTITAGRTTDQGGAIANGGNLTLTNCVVSDSTAIGAITFGGGIYNSGGLTLIRCAIVNNTVSGSTQAAGGGVGGSGGSLIFRDTTFSGNVCTGAGLLVGGGVGIASSTAFEVTNCTISGNSATFTSGFFAQNSTVTMVNTIVAGNSTLGDFAAGLAAASSNNFTSNDPLLAPYDPHLAPLGNYGGPTPTMPPLPGSPVIDAGKSGGTVSASDQRGKPRVGAVDIGAVESQGYTLTVSGGNTQAAAVGTAYASPLVVTVTARDADDPVNGGVVTFAAPGSGASVSFASSTVTISGGQASNTVTANGTIGSNTVTVTASGASTGASFNLTNAETPSLVVTTTSDTSTNTDSQTSLREALAYANSFTDGLPHTVTFSSSTANGAVNFYDGTARTITLGGSELVITNYVTIDGPGAGQLAVSGNNASRVFYVETTGIARLNGLTITGGNGIGAVNGGWGGGASSRGTLTVFRCVITGNTCGISGAGIYSGNPSVIPATLHVIESLVSENTAESAGIYHSGGACYVINSTISKNTGEGVRGNGGETIMINCTIADNHSSGVTGGVGATSFRFRNTIIAGNTGSKPDISLSIVSHKSLGYNLIGDTSGSAINPPATGDIYNVPAKLGALQNNGGPTATVALLADSPAFNAGSTVPEIQVFSVRGTAGTFTLTVDGQTTAPLPYNATAAQIHTALDGLSTVGPGNVDIQTNGGTFTLFYQGALANTNVPDITAASSGGATVQAQTLLQGGDMAADQRGKLRPQFSLVDMGAYEQTAADAGLPIVTTGGASWYVGPPAAGSDLRVYREVAGQVPEWVDNRTASYLAAAQDGTVMVKAAAGEVYVRVGSASGRGTSWQQVTAEVVAGDGATWFLGPDGTGGESYVYRWAADDTVGYADGTASQLYVTSNGTVLARTASSGVVYRAGSNSGLGTAWTQTAESLVVTTTADENDKTSDPAFGSGTSLREALAYAATLAGPQTITFSNSTANGAENFADGNVHAITLGGTELVIGSGVTILGPGANVLTVDAQAKSRVFEIASGATATLQGLSLVNGAAVGGDTDAVGGGAILNSGTLTVRACTISGSSVAFGLNGLGGGIYNGGTLTLLASTLSGNSAVGGIVHGGGLYNSGTAVVLNSTVSGNAAILTNSSNEAMGGGIYNGGTLTLGSSTLAGNQIAPPVSQRSTDDNNACTFDYMDELGQIHHIAKSTSPGHPCDPVKGIIGEATPQGGGGMFNDGLARVANTIIAGNTTLVGQPDLTGFFLSQGNNLIGISDGTNGLTNGVSEDQVGSSVIPLDAQLGVLSDNGGPTQTIALLPGSPAIDAGSNALAVDESNQLMTTDQRGMGFARVIQGRAATGAVQVDIGAYEYVPGTVQAPTFADGVAANGISVGTNDGVLSLAGVAVGATPAGGTFIGTGTGGANGATFSPTSLTPGDYVITYTTAANVDGFTASANFTIRVFDNVSPTVQIGAPSLTQTRTTPVTFTVTYADANLDAITLSPKDVTLIKTGTADGTAEISGTDATSRTVTITNLSGTGTLGISLAAGTASDAAGNLAPAAGPSATFIVDNTPLVADDYGFTRGKKPIDLDVLANDPAGAAGAVALRILTPPQHGTATIVNGKVHYVPTGRLPLEGDIFTYQYEDANGSVATGTVTIVNFNSIAGNYDGLVLPDGKTTGAERHEQSGRLRITIQPTGVFSGVLTLAGSRLNPIVRHNFLGYIVGIKLGTAGSSMRVLLRGSQSPVELAMQYDPVARQITGAVSSKDSSGQDFTSGVTLAEKTPAGARGGRYTLLVDPDATPNSPQGSGFAAVRIYSSGQVIALGKLADGTSFSSASWLHADNSFAIYSGLYSGPAALRGSLCGSMTFPVVPLVAGDASGTLDWFKPARPRDPWFPEGFDLNRTGLLARYLPPRNGAPALAFDATAENGRITIADGGFAQVDQPFTLSATNRISLAAPNESKVALTLNPANGLFRGQFLVPGTKVVAPFFGAVHQVDASGAGFFLNPVGHEAGAIDIRKN